MIFVCPKAAVAAVIETAGHVAVAQVAQVEFDMVTDAVAFPQVVGTETV